MRIMEELPDRQRRMLVAARLEQRRHVDIAAEFGVSVRTAERRSGTATCQQSMG